MPTALDELRKRLAEPPLPKELQITQVTNALYELGYELRVNGSHHQFRKPGAPRLTIAVHKKRIGPAAVRDLADLLGEQKRHSSLKGRLSMKTYIDLDTALSARYPFAAIPTPDGEGWEIVFPDIPGVIGFAETWDGIGEEARTILHFHLEGTAEDGHPLPAPNRDWNPIMRDSGDFGIPTLYSAEEASRALGISRRRVAALASSRNVGSKVGNALVFTDQDIDAMRDRTPGRPATHTDMARRAS